MFASGMAAGILYAYRNPVELKFMGVCRVIFPEFLVPSVT
jgi:hypothetical protein